MSKYISSNSDKNFGIYVICAINCIIVSFCFALIIAYYTPFVFDVMLFCLTLAIVATAAVYAGQYYYEYKI